MHGNRPITLEILLSFVPLFEGMGQEELARIARASRNIRLARNETLFRKNDPCEGFHVVVYGQVALTFTTADGTDRVVDILGSDRSFGEALMLADLPYMVTAQAESDSLLIYVPKAAVLEAMDSSPRLRLKLLTLVSAHLHQLIADGQVFSQQSAVQRFIAYLLRLIPGATRSERNVSVALPTSKGNISSLLNITREHFSRILHSLSEQGLITVQGSRIVIADVAALSDHLRDEPHLPRSGKGRNCARCATPTAGACPQTDRCA
ncbi:MAG TPA: Crp/Fnr family transcriptional regulator [Rhodocyclaceae bacterium]|nr:Crp/Fnr family transcriptional regulator [Rhodocyclaceae bacterium]